MRINIIILTVIFAAFGYHSATLAGSPAKEQLAVMDLQPKYGIDEDLAAAVSVIIRDQIHEFGTYEVLSQDDLQAIAEREAIQLTAGCDEVRCLLDFGSKIGTRYMVAGSLSRLGKTYLLSLRLLDTRGAQAGVKKRTNNSCKCSEDDLISLAQSVASELFGRVRNEVNVSLPPATAFKSAQPFE